MLTNRIGTPLLRPTTSAVNNLERESLPSLMLTREAQRTRNIGGVVQWAMLQYRNLISRQINPVVWGPGEQPSVLGTLHRQEKAHASEEDSRMYRLHCPMPIGSNIALV